MVIFGLPFFQIYGISGVRHETYNLTNFRSFITFAVVTGIIRKRTARAVLTGMCYSAGSAMRHGSSSLTR
ncbi:hypothetical protein SNA29_03445, partial [Escherichia coli]|nr:hypothetical protein [Escherichia coli]